MVKVVPFLRDDPNAPIAARFKRLKRDLKLAKSDIDRLQILGRLGDHAKILNRFNHGINYLTKAIELARHSESTPTIYTNQLRLALAHQYAGNHQKATAEFKSLLRHKKRLLAVDLLDFTHQHYGKCLAEVGEFRKARRQFDLALSLRQKLDKRSLLRSTEKAINHLQRMRQN